MAIVEMRDHNPRPSLSRLPALVPLMILLIPTASLAAWAVYADSWNSPTQAQEQAMRVNRRLDTRSATYERATVQGRVFWRVRVGVYRTRAEAQAIRRRLGEGGVSDTWMREVSDDLLPAAEPAEPEPSATRTDTARVDSIAQALIDSVSNLTRRRVDSLETATQQRLQQVVQQMRGQLTLEVLEQLEQDRARDRATYVTQAEQAQMTRALLDEMSSHLDALRDSLRREKLEQDRLAALLPHLSGSVAGRGTAEHQRPEAGPEATSARALLSEARFVVGWMGDASEVLVDLRAYEPTHIEARQAYAVWTFSRSGTARRAIGLGVTDAPYGLESPIWADLIAASPSDLTAMRPTALPALWIVPHESERVRLLLMPYGNWNEDDQSALAQVRLTWPGTILEFTAGGEQSRDTSNRGSSGVEGHIVTRWQGDRWLVGSEGLFGRRREPAYGEIQVKDGLRREVDTWGLLVLIHHRFAAHWGWTVRGDLLTEITRWTNDAYLTLPPGLPTFHMVIPLMEPLNRKGSFTTGPVVYVGSRFRMFLDYTFDLHEYRPTNGAKKILDQSHRFEFGVSHVF